MSSESFGKPLSWRKGAQHKTASATSKSLPKSAIIYDNEEIRKKYFEKKFEFKKSFQWSLPVDTFIDAKSDCDHHKLISVKQKLNQVKDKLNNYSLEAWSKHTQKRDPAGGIGWNLRKVINAEFVTKAWSKFYELVSAYQLIRFCDPSRGVFNSMHLCEAPGAFVAALNHFLQYNFTKNKVIFYTIHQICIYKFFFVIFFQLPLKWDWCATTLNPYYEGNALSSTVLDDRLILHTFEQWEFGKDFTGDLTTTTTIDALVLRAQQMGKVNTYLLLNVCQSFLNTLNLRNRYN